jgi:uncharacterized protein (DUF111 family)
MARLGDGGDGAGFVQMLSSHGETRVPKPAPTNSVRAGFVQMLSSHGETRVPKPAPTNLVPSYKFGQGGFCTNVIISWRNESP